MPTTVRDMTSPKPSPRIHDRASFPSNEPIDLGDHEHKDWEWRVDALARVLASKGITGVDQLRRAIESLSPERYEGSNYYERWRSGLEILLVEKGILTTQEIDQRAAASQALRA